MAEWWLGLTTYGQCGQNPDNTIAQKISCDKISCARFVTDDQCLCYTYGEIFVVFTSYCLH